MSTDAEKQVRTYFSVKTQEMLALARLAICEHPGLIGSHREQIQRVDLKDILPRRYSVDRGMVYGPFDKSREIDIVIWDQMNYPSLPMMDHRFFFAESVRCALECKSSWSSDEMGDVLRKCQSVNGIMQMNGLTLTDAIDQISHRVLAIEKDEQYEGQLSISHRIGTAAIFLNGGENFKLSNFNGNAISFEEAWPDAMLLLSSGKVVLKDFQSYGFGGQGSIAVYSLGDDALLVFTNALLNLLEQRSVMVENSLQLYKYVLNLKVEATEMISFPLTRPAAGRTTFWS